MYEGVVEQGSWELKFKQFWGLSSFTFFCFIQHRVYLALIVVETLTDTLIEVLLLWGFNSTDTLLHSSLEL